MENGYDCLIESVRSHKCIYDKSSKDFKNIVTKEKVWNEVAEATGLTTDECRRKWTVLRERFNKEQKKRDLPTGSEAVSYEDWPYYDSMVFLKDFVQPRKTRKNVFRDKKEDENNNLDTDIDISNCSTNTSVEIYSKKAKLKDKDLAYEEACEAIRSAAETIQAENTIQQPPQVTGRHEIGQNFMRSVLLMLEPLPDIDYDSALAQIMQFVVDLRRCRLHIEEGDNL